MKAMTTKVVITPALTMVMTTMTIEKKKAWEKKSSVTSPERMSTTATNKVPMLALSEKFPRTQTSRTTPKESRVADRVIPTGDIKTSSATSPERTSTTATNTVPMLALSEKFPRTQTSRTTPKESRVADRVIPTGDIKTSSATSPERTSTTATNTVPMLALSEKFPRTQTSRTTPKESVVALRVIPTGEGKLPRKVVVPIIVQYYFQQKSSLFYYISRFHHNFSSLFFLSTKKKEKRRRRCTTTISPLVWRCQTAPQEGGRFLRASSRATTTADGEGGRRPCASSVAGEDDRR